MKFSFKTRHATTFSAFLNGCYAIILFILIHSCSPNDITDDISCQLTFSADTIQFDTIFTTLGSATHRLLVYNPHRQAIRTNITLAGGNSSPFRINIDGIAAETARNIEIQAEDSMYVFIEVTVQPQSSDFPVLISDSILFETNTNRQIVQLEAFGQDVHILRNQKIGTTTWTGHKPYLIYGQLTVDTLEILRIEAGTRIYLHKEADIHVKGSLIAEGTADQPIIFSGDRLEEIYRDIPGQWGSLIFETSGRDNRLKHVEIRNGTNGLILGSINNKFIPSITMEEVKIENMASAGITALTSDINAVNCLLANCREHVIGLFGGGTSRFVYCTVVNNYSSYIHRISTSALTIKSTYANVEGEIRGDFFLGNSIIFGTMNNEIDVRETDIYRFDHCLLKTDIDTKTSAFSDIMLNLDPLFIDSYQSDFRLHEKSPARDAADHQIAPSITTDVHGNIRFFGSAPDLGACEWIPEL